MNKVKVKVRENERRKKPYSRARTSIFNGRSMTPIPTPPQPHHPTHTIRLHHIPQRTLPEYRHEREITPQPAPTIPTNARPTNHRLISRVYNSPPRYPAHRKRTNTGPTAMFQPCKTDLGRRRRRRMCGLGLFGFGDNIVRDAVRDCFCCCG